MKSVKLLEELGYKFDSDGVLRDLKTGGKFTFIDQKHYDRLGDAVIAYIQEVMETKYELTRVNLPLDQKSQPINIYLSKNALTTEGKLLLIIQGLGAVRAGMWARALCINDSLKTGTIFTYLEQAKAEGYEVIVLNPNINKYENGELIPGNESEQNHVRYVWDNFVRKAKAKHVFIVAHSYGGVTVVDLLATREEEVMDRVRCIAFTDSAHYLYIGNPLHMPCKPLSEKAENFLFERSRNWIRSDTKLDTPLEDIREGVYCVSAGHPKHEYTSYSCQSSVFKFMNDIHNGKIEIPKKPTINDRINRLTNLKEEANSIYKKNLFKEAVSKYNKVLETMAGVDKWRDCTKVHAKKLKEIEIGVLLNLCLAYLKLKEYKKTIKHATKVLAYDSNNLKALLRRGTAFLELKDLENAGEDLTKAYNLNQTDKSIKEQYEMWKKMTKKRREREKRKFKLLFS